MDKASAPQQPRVSRSLENGRLPFPKKSLGLSTRFSVCASLRRVVAGLLWRGLKIALPAWAVAEFIFFFYQLQRRYALSTAPIKMPACENPMATFRR
jgi:hypothetical protein